MMQSPYHQSQHPGSIMMNNNITLVNSNMIPKNSYIYRNMVMLLYNSVAISALKYSLFETNKMSFFFAIINLRNKEIHWHVIMAW